MKENSISYRKYRDFLNGNGLSFEKLAIEFFHHQRKYNQVYKKFLSFFQRDFSLVNNVATIPFMPVSFFKNNIIKTGEWEEELIFESSSTSGTIPSKHYVKDIKHYSENTEICFNHVLGDISNYCFFALLPSYLEKNRSSLVLMLEHFIKRSKCGKFYKTDYPSLYTDLETYQGEKKLLLLGVTYALLEFAGRYNVEKELIVIETGGMKGRGKELPREAVHEKLLNSFNTTKIYSEYGMAELMSQSYSKADGVFTPSPSMKILISDIYDPFSILKEPKQGRINIIDLANYDTCCFLATDDLGILLDDHKFKVLGRTDESDIRGCNLLFS